MMIFNWLTRTRTPSRTIGDAKASRALTPDEVEACRGQLSQSQLRKARQYINNSLEREGAKENPWPHEGHSSAFWIYEDFDPGVVAEVKREYEAAGWKVTQQPSFDGDGGVMNFFPPRKTR